jgi:ATP-dependent RNA/DNA helicase IGHMBP2
LAFNTERFQNLIKAIDAERNQEIEFFNTFKTLSSTNSKVKAGIAWQAVNINRKYYGLGEALEIEVERTKHLDQPHKFTTGVSVLLSNNDAEIPSIKATIGYVRGNKMRLVTFSDVMEALEDYDNGITVVELIYDDRPYKVMETAIKDVINSKNPFITDLTKSINNGIFSPPTTFIPSANIINRLDINESQKSAIVSACSSNDVSIIHGPPGTGKTTTLVALIQELAIKEKRILVCASSNNAVDLLTSKLDKVGLDVLRIGNITRIDDDVSHLTIDEKVRSHVEWSHIKKVRIQANDCETKAGKYKRSFGPEERKLRRELRHEARELRKWAIELEDRVIHEMILATKIVTSTLIGASHHSIVDLLFDTVVIDEASQALEPECWNAILRGKRVILAGDHMQLPPTVKSSNALKFGLSTTLLDQLINQVQSGGLLNVQYRMHDAILAFSNINYYKGLLKSHENVANRLIKSDNLPLMMIDTAGCGFDEEQHSETRSYYNKGEFFIIREHLLLIREKLLGHSIGIIAPYSEQVRFIRAQIEDDELLRLMSIDVDSVDGFQGQERDIIYLSLVRSNERSEIGFVKDERRLNVALTRAKSKLVIVGDSATLAVHPTYGALVDHIIITGHYDSAWTYMSS